MQKQIFAALGLAVAAAGAQAQVLLSEGFENVSTLSGWVMLNNSSPAGAIGPWFQGDDSQFTAQSGADTSFIASNYNVGAAGGTLSAWLITPTFATDKAVDIVFYARGAADPGYFDQIAYGWSAGGSTPGSFTMTAPATVTTNGWTQYTVHLAAQGAGTTGRFAINYAGMDDNANYVGIDNLSVSVAAAVPEPSAALLMGAGLMGLVGWTRRRMAR